MEEDTSPIICQAVGNDSPRGLTGRNTKQKTSDGIELDNAYEDRVKRRLREENNGLTNFCGDARLCSSNGLKAAGDNMLCKECVMNNRTEE